MKISTDRSRIEAILDRGIITTILPSRESFIEALLERKLRFYIGADPTAASLHLSHAKNYMILEEFRKLGHEVIVLVGDFTAQIGDPTGRDTLRKELSQAEIEENVKGWLTQIKPLMDFEVTENPPQVKYNSEWLGALTFQKVVELASHFTVQQMLERDMFEKRVKENRPIHVHEFLYPLMQGYDSVAMDVDVELCGTDQTFNALAGRTLLKRYANKEKFVVAVNLMEDPVSGELMSKSKGTGVFLGGSALDMFGAIMAQPDSMIPVLLINNTRLPQTDINAISLLPNPKDQKLKTALEIVSIFYGQEMAERALGEWEHVFSERHVPTDMPEVTPGEDLPGVLVSIGIVASKSEWRRLIEEGGVSFENEKITDPFWKPGKSGVLKVGKRRFVRLIV